MRKSLLATTAGIAIALGTAAASQATVVVLDNFENGDRRAMDDGTQYWFFTNEFATESGGSLRFTNSVDMVQSTTNDPNLNFFNQPLKIAVNGMAFSGTGGNSQLNFGMVANGSNTSSNDGIIWRINYNSADNTTTLRLNSKLNTSGADVLAGAGPFRVNEVRSGVITDFELTITPTGYEWKIDGPAMTGGSETFTGTWSHAAFTVDEWNHTAGDGRANIRIQHSANLTNGTVETSMSALSITQVVPEPAMLGLAALGGLGLLRRRQRA